MHIYFKRRAKYVFFPFIILMLVIDTQTFIERP